MSSESILHIAPDEKFIDAADYLYEKAFPGKNTFFIIKPAANPPLKYVKPKDHFNILIRSPELDDILFKAVKKHRIIVFHGLSTDMLKVFNRSDYKEKFIWTFWGGEIYNSELYDESIFGPKTKRIEQKMRKNTFMDLIKRVYRKMRYSSINDNGSIDRKEIINQFHYVAKLNDNIDLFKSMGLVNDYCKTIPFTYYPLEYLFSRSSGTVTGNNILLGNSSSTTNNHVEMIDFLAGLNLKDQKVITPLSYGSKKYASIIKKYGQKKLGDSFHPMTEFMPLENYHDYIRSCGLVIMNHYRPQGVGTSLSSLYMGSKLFLNDTSFYRYLKGIDCHVYTIEEDLIKNPDTALQNLTQEQIRHNRKRLEEEISTEAVVEKIRLSFHENFNFL